MTDERVEFPGVEGHRLSARLSRPAGGRVRAWALFAHCFTCSKDLKPAHHVTRALNQAGIGVLRFDFTGLGESEGDFADTTFSSNVGDLVAAARWLAEEHEGPAILVGHSLGGAAVVHAAREIGTCRAVTTIGAPHDPEHITHLFRDALDEIDAEGRAAVEIAGRRFTVRREFVEDLRAQRMDEALGSLGLPLLILHSPVDQVVGIDNAARIYAAARHPKSFVSLDDAGHLLLDGRDSRYVGSVLAAWAERYLEPRAERGAPEDRLAEDRRVSARTAAGSFQTEIQARGHPLIADEPESVGGDDAGPTPYDLLSAALGACTTMTLVMYAERKGWPLEEAAVRLKHAKIHARDEERCEEEDARMDRIEREVTLVGDLDDEQRARLLEIADRCPVHRTLSAGVDIATQGS